MSNTISSMICSAHQVFGNEDKKHTDLLFFFVCAFIFGVNSLDIMLYWQKFIFESFYLNWFSIKKKISYVMSDLSMHLLQWK